MLAFGASAQDQLKSIGEIDFFGYSRIDLNKVRAAVPSHEKEEFNAETFSEKVEPASEAVKHYRIYPIPALLSPSK
jgi:hypothetical protein